MNLSFLVICSTTYLLGVTWVILELLVGEDTAHTRGFYRSSNLFCEKQKNATAVLLIHT